MISTVDAAMGLPLEYKIEIFQNKNSKTYFKAFGNVEIKAIFIQLLIKNHPLNTYYIPGTVLDTRDIVGSEIGKVSYLLGFT